MDDSMRMEVLDSIANLHYVALNFEFMEALTSSEELIEGSGTAHFKQNVHILGVLEEVFEADNIGVMEGSMDLNF